MVSDAYGRLVDHITALIAEVGFEGLSVRAVATRAGVSIGAVQHHFPTRAVMVRAATETIVARASEHYSEGVQTLPDPEQLLRAVIDGLLPRDSADVSARVWIAVAARAVVDPELGEIHATTARRIRRGMAMLIAAATGRPKEAERAATELFALVDGLTVSVLTEPQGVDPATARDLAYRRLSDLLTR